MINFDGSTAFIVSLFSGKPYRNFLYPIIIISNKENLKSKRIFNNLFDDDNGITK